ncbi:nucleoside triphosphate pyrophosphohydrolase [Sinanaerobacter chloroacetimidivorans]|jgi:tetrapyrrole methylase family protein/MazG family protein|uniref:Nucleoside triphosphate pyrophosphohydrolase n=1 Tax=Sinanaerobacter chloroacetimidivorans TaxID=2818044 RepID=A0A8J7W3Z4_9FIRM|nr:nucleoside triphosphate pyrophosphohydrolase [Sinanaerobacter chloroacetimidivorans]MBR0600434.1 nucleoside triphosphate pyrophosphohydrolase [Sinanaerobacter chloroacetimidivorans]
MDKKYAEYYKEGKTAEEAITRLADIIALLRSEDGCPWDKVQTHESLKECLIEEAYEVAEAIDRQDMDNLEEELGDVLLQVIFHSDLQKERSGFDLRSIANRECEKMLRRHPHVFLNKNTETIDKAVEKWENVKRKERGTATHTDSMMNVPRALPALIRSYKIQKKAADVGFDWEDVSDAFSKVKEETCELLEIYREGSEVRIKEEVGDLLFAVVNVARFLGVNPEEALNFTSSKFINRFRFIEESARLRGTTPEEMSLEEMDKLWDEAKEKV